MNKLIIVDNGMNKTNSFNFCVTLRRVIAYNLQSFSSFAVSVLNRFWNKSAGTFLVADE